MKQIFAAIEDHPQLKYLDISANHVGSESFRLLFGMIQRNKIRL